ncbi:CPBP family intramembrane glutamic endopeptidase [Sphingobacterium tabacisoli]|uniref:CPBP family intramembrane glutamic endopeptidase n=1 Tax=Sphingobacterium tabacisoli TaxID=2044855 RepID=A0ABW5KYM1_9SPHI|nr:CPBP family intramembrane glutamic endopeptidase [Sphingobacterium tabacisoli]
MNQYLGKPNSPWSSLLILLVLTLACSVGVQFIILLLGVISDRGLTEVLQNEGGLSSFSNRPFFLYALLIASSFGTFLLPAFILQRLEPYFNYFPAENKKNGITYLIAVALLFAFGPIMQLIGDANAQMTFPDSLKGVETWMRLQEDNMASLTERIVMIDRWELLLVNVVVMAVMPAIAEEYYFRGSLMHIIQRLVKNYHITVWLSAIIFSAIHVQFFGFFPRMILGVFFGYMFVWTQNIWIPILAHFVNNATVAVLAFVYTRQGKTYAELQSYDSYSIFVYIGGFILTILLGIWFYKISKQKQANGERLEKNTSI